MYSMTTVNSKTSEYRNKKLLDRTTREYVLNTWNQFQPEWFVSLLWNDFPTSPVTSVSHTRHLRNVLLCDLYKVNRCSSLPVFPDRLGLTVFQERTEVQGSKVTFHTHIHISNTGGLWSTPEALEVYLRYNIGKRVKKLLKTDTQYNEGVTVKKWIAERHRSYNFKEQQSQQSKRLTRFTQDRDLLLDVENSDLLPLSSSSYGHQRLPTRSY